MQIIINVPEHLEEQHGLLRELVQAMVNRLTLDISKPPKKLGRPPTKAGRNEAIWEHVKQGHTHAQIAAVFSISLPRVAQIVAQMRASEENTMTQGEGSV